MKKNLFIIGLTIVCLTTLFSCKNEKFTNNNDVTEQKHDIITLNQLDGNWVTIALYNEDEDAFFPISDPKKATCFMFLKRSMVCAVAFGDEEGGEIRAENFTLKNDTIRISEGFDAIILAVNGNTNNYLDVTMYGNWDKSKHFRFKLKKITDD